MKDAYRAEVVEENLQIAKKAHTGLRPGFNVGDFYAHKFGACWKAFDAYCVSEFPTNSVEARLKQFKAPFSRLPYAGLSVVERPRLH